ncbi:hypothetical protein GIB67_002943 [Kingdonia uniflora]|uniref:Uncharacterized protein n=1 Tax=Kingdonia uniflora TaxID=39325 RepID=A0A7J7M8Y9_9MAGN|nr:hypothetical protein GIB67_002943 [Kingdonia uniflora]
MIHICIICIYFTLLNFNNIIVIDLVDKYVDFDYLNKGSSPHSLIFTFSDYQIKDSLLRLFF